MILDLFAGFFWPAFWAVLFTYALWGPRTTGYFWTLACVSACGGIVGTAFTHHGWTLPGYLFWIIAALWYFTRRRRKRAAQLLGAKTRALRDALVRKARELSQPRPVLRPVPS